MSKELIAINISWHLFIFNLDDIPIERVFIKLLELSFYENHNLVWLLGGMLDGISYNLFVSLFHRNDKFSQFDLASLGNEAEVDYLSGEHASLKYHKEQSWISELKLHF